MSLMPTHLPILMYHQIMPESHQDYKKHISVTPESLRSQIKLILEEGWSIVTLEEYFATPLEKRSAKTLVLSFDDVCRNFIEYALPVFEELKVRANIFPIQNMTRGEKFYNLKTEGVPPLTEAEIKELDQKGFTVGSHCQSHRNLHKLPFTEAYKELKESKVWLEGILGREIQTICFPIGGIDKDLVEASKEIGYSIGLSTFKGSLQLLPTDIMALRRVNIKNDVLGDKLKSHIGPFYGFRRFLTRPFRSKYKVTNRHPDKVS